MQMLFLIAVALFVGFLCGCTGVGGVLLIPALNACSDLGLRKVMATLLFSFIFSGLLGSYLYNRARLIDWRGGLPLWLGCALTGVAGSVAKEYVSVPTLGALLGAIIVLAGITAMRPVTGVGLLPAAPRRRQDAVLFLVGAGISFLSCMTGAGGPVLSIPAMLILGYAPITAIAASQPLTIVVTVAGSAGNAFLGDIDYGVGLIMAALQLGGVGAGVYSLRYFKPDALKKIAGLFCAGTGAYMLTRNLFL